MWRAGTRRCMEEGTEWLPPSTRFLQMRFSQPGLSRPCPIPDTHLGRCSIRSPGPCLRRRIMRRGGHKFLGSLWAESRASSVEPNQLVSVTSTRNPPTPGPTHSRVGFLYLLVPDAAAVRLPDLIETPYPAVSEEHRETARCCSNHVFFNILLISWVSEELAEATR